ncbi:Uncharacterised protein [Klebsiella variicola]|nr:Uncharacterised protein [Klebsiella variicola]
MTSKLTITYECLAYLVAPKRSGCNDINTDNEHA